MKPYLPLIALSLASAVCAEDENKFAGTPIDISDWACQRAVQADRGGVIELDLDPAVLVRAAHDLHDLRIVRAGRQIPFLIIKPGAERDMQVPVSEVIDPKEPLLSKWDIQLPTAGFPASDVVLESATPDFAQTLAVSEPQEGGGLRTLATSSWKRQPGEPAKALRLTFLSPPHAATLRLATTTSDTPRVQIASARIVYPLVRLLFQVPDPSNVHLCYGNPKAINPQYNLQVTRRDFASGAKVAATLGPEEKPSAHAVTVNTIVGKASWNWDMLMADIAELFGKFDKDNPRHLGGLAIACVVLMWLLSKLFSKKRED